MSGNARRPLVGHSGIELTLIEYSNFTAVRKRASRASQNDRLRRQCAKMRAAQEFGIVCPAVLTEGEEDGAYFFEMEYVPGENLGHAVLSGRDLQWSDLIGQIAVVLDRYRSAQNGTIPASAFLRKLQNITLNCADVPAVTPVLARIRHVASALAGMDWNGVSQSPCHGDMTLENILVRRDGRLVFIDFDVPEQSSWQLDAAKLYQDLYGQWFLRDLAVARPDSPELINARIKLQGVAEDFDAAINSILPWRRDRIRQLAAFHLMRTLPYARGSPTAQFVTAQIERLLETGA